MTEENIVIAKSKNQGETKKYTYLVTGGAGFIGSNLVERLIKEGHKVIIIDTLTTGNLKNLEGIENIEIWNGTITQILKKHKFEINGVFHLGMASSAPMYEENPDLVGKTINDFLVLLELAKEKKIPIVYASTSSLYDGNNLPFKEDMNLKIKALYSETRIAMERLAKLYFNLYNVCSIGLRFFSVYGPKEKYKGKYANLVSQAIWAMQKDEEFIVYGDGTQTRDYIYVSDVVDGLLLAMDKAKKENICEVYNIGTGINHSLYDTLTFIEEIGGKKMKLKYIKNPIKNYVQDTLADITKAEEELEFKLK